MSSAFSVYATDKSLVVTSNTGKNQGSVTVYDMVGRYVATASLDGNGSCRVNLTSPAGYYLVKVVAGELTYTTKVFIN